MQRSFARYEPLFFYGYLISFISLSSLHLFTGYADNGDFTRNTAFLFEKPDGFILNWPLPGTEEHKHRFFYYWNDKWLFLPSWPNYFNLNTYSSYKLYLLFQAEVSTLLTGINFYYSIILGSIVSRTLIFISLAGLLFYLRKGLPLWNFWIFTIIISIVLLDTSWMAFINSFYEEQIPIVFFP